MIDTTALEGAALATARLVGEVDGLHIYAIKVDGDGTAPADTAVCGSDEPTAAAGAPDPDNAAPRAAPGPVSPQQEHALAAWVAALDLDTEVGNNGPYAVLFEIRKRARALFSVPVPVPDEMQRLRLVEDIGRKLLGKGKRASILQGVLRTHRVERLSDLPVDELDAVLRHVAQMAHAQGWQ